MQWDLDKAVQYLRQHKEPGSTGHCAQYVRQAIEAGGVTLHRHGSAKDYGPSLTAVGFQKISSGAGYLHRAGDVGIVQPIPGHPHGHMAMFDGTHWISDFVQMHGIYPGQSYRDAKPAYQIYRHPATWTGIDSPSTSTSTSTSMA
jgi:hypothetical protein